jgi:hypothetical protein
MYSILPAFKAVLPTYPFTFGNLFIYFSDGVLEPGLVLNDNKQEEEEEELLLKVVA